MLDKGQMRRVVADEKVNPNENTKQAQQFIFQNACEIICFIQLKLIVVLKIEARQWQRFRAASLHLTFPLLHTFASSVNAKSRSTFKL